MLRCCLGHSTNYQFQTSTFPLMILAMPSSQAPLCSTRSAWNLRMLFTRLWIPANHWTRVLPRLQTRKKVGRMQTLIAS